MNTVFSFKTKSFPMLAFVLHHAEQTGVANAVYVNETRGYVEFYAPEAVARIEAAARVALADSESRSASSESARRERMLKALIAKFSN